MFCYNCGCRLSEHDFCTSCGADVARYKKIMSIANMYYNDGLAKAKVRDLTGAITSLRQCLKFNKNHIEARNLLGLVYFEMGEVVAALSEWVISKNLKPDKNIADDYINVIQSSAGRLDSMNQTIKKYNQALYYCQQDSKDLAIIQLKKVLSMNSKFVRAHQLLALLYIDSEQWERARRELTKCMDIDRNNTQTLYYMKEVEKILAPDETGRVSRKKADESVRYQSDNEVIIQPLGISEPKRSGAGTLLNIGIGLMIGAAAVYFLVVPAVKTNVQNKSQQTITEIGNQIDEKNNTITSLENANRDLQEENDRLNTELQQYVGTNGTLESMDTLLSVAAAYLTEGNVEQTAQALEEISVSLVLEETSESFQNLYNALMADVAPLMAKTNYDEGYTYYQNQNYADAAVSMQKAVDYLTKLSDFDHTLDYAWYYLGQSYRLTDEKEKAVESYTKFVELQPGTDRARRAQSYIDELSE